MGSTTEGFVSPFDQDFNVLPGSIASRRKHFPIEEAFKRVPLVYACCDIISAAIATVPLIFLKKGSRGGSEKAFKYLKGLKGLKYNRSGGIDSQWLLERGKVIRDMKKEGLVEEIEVDHPVHELLDIPNLYELNSFEDLSYLTNLNPLLFGEYFWLLDEFKRGVPTKIITETTFYMRHILKNGNLDHWDRLVIEKHKTKFEPWQPEHVVQFKYPNPYNRFRGLSPVKAGRMTIEQFMNIAVWNAGLFKAGVRPPLVIETEQGIFGAQYDAWIQQLLKRFTGFIKGHWPLILTRGAKARKLYDERELDFLKTIELTKEEIAQLYHVPPALVGIFRYANYANAKMQKEVFWELGNLPRMLWFQRTLQNNLLSPYFPDTVAEWEWETVKALAPSPLDRTKAQWQESETVKNYWEMGLEFDKIAEIVGNPLLVGGSTAFAKEKDPEKATVFIENCYLEPIPRDESIEYRASEGFFEAYARNYFRHFLSPFSRKLSASFKGLLQEMVESVVKDENLKTLDEEEWRQRWSDLICNLTKNAFFSGLNSVYMELMNPEDAVISSTFRCSEQIKDLFSEEQQEKIEEIIGDLSRVDGFISPTVKGINRVITDISFDNEAKIKGKSLKKRIFEEQERLFMRYGKSFGVSQAGLSYNVGRFVAMKQFNVLRHVWISNEKCVKHQKMHGKEVLFGEKFPVVNMCYPYDPNSKEKGDSSCSCLTLATLVKKPERLALPISVEDSVIEGAYDIHWDEKPYPNEHACRIREPIKGAPTKRKNNARKHDGKAYDIIYQKQKGSWVEQAYRYKKSTWTATQARSHCKSHSGRFEAARDKCLTCGD